MKIYLRIITIVFLISLQTVQGQDLIRFQNLTVNDGLSMGTITAVQQDSFGYTWIATAEGLHRYDGRHFKIFKHQDGQANSLSDSYIRCLKRIGNSLFIGTNSGIVDILNLTDYTFKHINPSDVSPNFDYPISVMEQFQNELVIGTEGGGLWFYSEKKNHLRAYSALSGQAVVTDLKTHNDAFYASINDEIFKCSFRKADVVAKSPNGQITAFDFFNQDIVVGTDKGLVLIESRSNDYREFNLPEKKRRISFITDIVVRDNDIWVGSIGGLIHYSNGNMVHYEHNDIRPFSLVNNQVNFLYFDTDQTLWIGTITGLSRYSPALKKFGLLQYFDFEGTTYSSIVYYVYEDKAGYVWLGTLSGGLLKLNRQHQIIDVFPLIKDGDVETKAVRCIYEDSKGDFWVGTRDEGLFIFNEKQRSFRQIKGNGGSKLNGSVIRAIYEDSRHNLWIGTDGGLNLLDTENETYTLYRSEPKVLTNNSVYQITEDPNSNQLIIASFRGGLQFFNLDTKRFISLKNNSNDPASLSNNNVMCLEWMNKDSLLVGTYGGGLNIVSVKNKECTHVTEEDGLINNVVYGILYQGNGVVWMSTNNGLVKYHLYKKSFVNFRPVHYLQNTEYNEGAFCKSSDGCFYFGGVTGLNYFQPTRMKFDTVSPPIRITDIRAEYIQRGANDIELSFLNSRLELDFTALYFINPEGIKYKYRLLGYDQDWVSPKFSNTAIYPRLSPGSYSFEVIAEDEFGYWKKEEFLLNVYVKPPFWQRWWFIVLITLLLIGGVLALFRFRTKAIEKSYKHQLVDSELRALRSQMNPHFIFNSLNSIQYFILKKQPQEAYTYLSKFASLMRKILQNSRLKYISIQDEAEWLELYLEMEKLRMDNNLDYHINLDQVPDVDYTYIPTMLIQPYVENGIIHGLLSKEDDRRISITFIKKEDHVECVVEDNGIGREASKILNEKRTRKHDSAGMALTKTRLKILSEGKGEFDVRIDDLYEKGKACGTRVTILIPLMNNTDG